MTARSFLFTLPPMSSLPWPGTPASHQYAIGGTIIRTRGTIFCLRRSRGKIPFGLTACLQNHPLIPHSLRHPLAIEVLQQRNRVLAAHASHFFELAYVDPGRLRLVPRNLLAQRVQRRLVKHELVGDLDEHLLAQ